MPFTVHYNQTQEAGTLGIDQGFLSEPLEFIHSFTYSQSFIYFFHSTNFSSNTVFVSCYKLPQTQWHKSTYIYSYSSGSGHFSQFHWGKVRRSVGQIFPKGSEGRIRFLAFFCFQGLPEFLSLQPLPPSSKCIPPTSASFLTSPSPLVWLFLSSYKDCCDDTRSNPIIQDNLLSR